MTTQVRITIVPCTLPVANGYVSRLHRHHSVLPGGFAWFCCAAVTPDGEVIGVAIAGRPTNRNDDDGQTVEVLRVATDGTANAPSALLAACARAAEAIGAHRVLTYTLTSEGGASLRGAGWTCEESDCGKSFWGNANTRTPAVQRAHFAESKARWAKHFRPSAVAVQWHIDDAKEAASMSLFANVKP